MEYKSQVLRVSLHQGVSDLMQIASVLDKLDLGLKEELYTCIHKAAQDVKSVVTYDLRLARPLLANQMLTEKLLLNSQFLEITNIIAKEANVPEIVAGVIVISTWDLVSQ
ncbi:hypothetical protein KFU94_64355 [Chloroflexi bacterium TSY]|nr:hypothetical protein [Chloroflexi bacterium TSY]